MLLFIDTSDLETAKLALIDRQVVWHKMAAHDLSEKLTSEIKKFLQKQKIDLRKIKKLAVVVGPGGFSKIRTSVATANALGLALGIPIVPVKTTDVPADLKMLLSEKGQKMVVPFYDRAPNITLIKKSK